MSETLTRSFNFEVTRTVAETDGLLLEGYAAVFNSPTLIDSAREGRFNEIIAPGAFKKTLSDRTPVLQFDHGSHPLIGSIPLGVIQHVREDAHGLFVRARLSNNWLIQPVRDAIAEGAIKGMSFRFSVPEGRDKWDQRTDPPTRTVTEAKLFELGPVVWPAYESTSVGVRSRQLADLLADEEVRHDLANLLTFGQPSADADPVTSDEEPDTPPSRHLSPEQESHIVELRTRLQTLKEKNGEAA